jgi:FlgD Ig-like domain
MIPAEKRGLSVIRAKLAPAGTLLVLAGFASVSHAQWTSTNGPIGDPTGSLTFSNGGAYLLAGTAGSGAFRSTGDFDEWTPAAGLPSTRVLSLATGVNFSGGEVQLAGTNEDGVFASWNQGANWSAANTGLADAAVNAVIAIQDQYFGFGLVLFAGTDAGVYRSNGGQNVLWVHRGGGLTNSNVRALVSVPGGDENDGIGARDLFAGTAGGVFLSTDGVSWLAKNTGLTNANVLSLGASEPSPFAWTLFAGTTTGVFRSTDLYGSWTAASNGLSGGAVQALLGVGARIFAGTATGGVFVSTDQGNNWAAVNAGLGDLGVTALASDGTDLFAATASGVFRRPLSQLNGTTAVEDRGVLVLSLEAPRPNPFASSTWARYTLSAGGDVRLAIHDLQGRRVLVLADGVHSAGVHQVEWNGRTVEGLRARAGVYFLRLEQDRRVLSRPIVLLP